MKQVAEIELRVETSLFSHTAMGIDRSELTGATLRGAMRFWFRALMGRYAALPELEQLERQIFGGRDQLRFRITVEPKSAPKDFSANDKSLLPHKNRELPKGSRIASLAPGMSYIVTLAAAAPEQAPLLLWSLWLATTLGGVGKRARRGAGALRIAALSGFDGIGSDRYVFSGKSSAELTQFISSGLRAARKDFQSFAIAQGKSSGELPNGPEFPAFAPVRVGDTLIPLTWLRPVSGPTEVDARAAVMLELREFKSPVFGLPLHRSDRWEKLPKRAQRVPSPLWVRLWQLESDWVAAYTTLPPLPECTDEDKAALARFVTKLEAASSISAETFEVQQ